MQTSNYWKQFEKTGRIEDYLTYVQSEHHVQNVQSVRNQQNGQNVPDVRDVPKQRERAGDSEKEQRGEAPYAGFC